jgi:uncharacterized membrane protein YphA (DoxX/SURF4 family)
MENSQLNQSWWSLRITYGLLAFLAGLDKFFNLLTNWEHYLSPAVTSMVPVSASTLMHAVGIVEMAVGLLILTRWTRLGAYIASVWLLCIAFNLALTGSFFDVAVRDLALSVGAFTLARLSEAHYPVRHTASVSAHPAHI